MFPNASRAPYDAAERAARAHQLALSSAEVRAELTNLSHLWLREAHLEMAALEPGVTGRCSHAPQFPATLSLPWWGPCTS